MPEYSLETLLQLYFDDQLTKEQEQELFALINQGTHDEEIKLFMDRSWPRLATHYTLPDNDKDAILRSIFNRPLRRVHFLKNTWVRYAAAAILLFVVGSLWFVIDRRDGGQPEVVQTPVDMAPGREGAVLTLADGRQLVLDSMGNGVVAEQDGSAVALNDGRLSYEKSGVGSQEFGVKYNTLTTPRGRQFQLTLPDGSKVWLNAASSITYPTVFAGNERNVKITGEAYFEVAKDKQKPFKVNMKDAGTVEVLGTHFNINAYDDEDVIRTTLLEGKVKVSATSGSRLPTPDSRLLNPGEQAIIADQIKVTNEINVDQVMAWKNGAFDFAGQDFAASMRQLERWYDVKVVYDGPVPTGRLGGKIGRDLSLMQVVKLLDGVVAKFNFENKQLHVLP